MLASFTLCLRPLELDLTLIDIDFDVEFVSEFANVATTLTNKLIGMLLGEIKSGQDEATLLLIGNSSFYKGIDLGSE